MPSSNIYWVIQIHPLIASLKTVNDGLLRSVSKNYPDARFKGKNNMIVDLISGPADITQKSINTVRHTFLSQGNSTIMHRQKCESINNGNTSFLTLSFTNYKQPHLTY